MLHPAKNAMKALPESVMVHSDEEDKKISLYSIYRETEPNSSPSLIDKVEIEQQISRSEDPTIELKETIQNEMSLVAD